MTAKSPDWKSFLGARAWVAYGLTALVLVGGYFLLQRTPDVSLKSVLEAMRQFPIATIAFAFLLWSLQNLASTVRLHVLLEPQARGPLWETWQAISVGQWINAFLPARVGDAMKIFLVNRRHPGHAFSIAGTLVADRVADLIALTSVILIAGAHHGAFHFPQVPLWIVPTVLGTLAVAVALTVKLLGPKARAKLTAALSQIAHGLRGLKRPGPLLLAILVSAFGWMCESASLILLVRALGFPLAPEQGIYLLFLLNAATAVPISVGQVGTFEASIVYALGTLNVGTTPALAVALMHHFVYFAMLAFWSLVTTLLVRYLPAGSGDGDGGAVGIAAASASRKRRKSA